MNKKFSLFIIITSLVVSLSACSSKPISSTNTVSKIHATVSSKLVEAASKTKVDIQTMTHDSRIKSTQITNTNSYIVKDAGLYDPPSNKPLILGSAEYIEKIQNIAKKFGDPIALSVIMLDVDKNPNQLDSNQLDNISRFHNLVSSLIYNIGYVDMETNYFRNKLNRVPKTLEELISLNKTLPISKRWILLSVAGSGYHMQGVDGEYNLKFVSYDVFYEAVYNKKGILLNENNDPINMGTYNYAPGIHVINAHVKFDQTPYLIWGNTANSPQKGRDAINKGVSLGIINYKEHAVSVYAYRQNLFGMQEGRVPIIEKINSPIKHAMKT